MTDTSPNFKVTKENGRARVFIHCSNLECEALVREMKPHESIAVNRCYYCEDCDDGTVKLNMPKDKPHD